MNNKIHKTIAWMTALILLFSAFFTQTGIVTAEGTPTISPTVTVVGVNEGGIIDPAVGITISISLPDIPVKGDEEPDYFEYMDTFTILISEYFMFDDLNPPSDQDLMFEGVKVGTVKFSNVDGHAVATIVFDGEEYIFDPEHVDLVGPPYSDVSALFTCNLVFNGDYETEPGGDEYVTILDKTYYLKMPGDTLTYGVIKEVGSVNLAAGTITWSVTITGESDTEPLPTPLDLAGFLFEDDLTDVGTYVDGSFTASNSDGPILLATPIFIGSELTYTIPDLSFSPVVITFTTEIPDDVLAVGGTVTNTAEVSDNELPIGSDSASTTITGPTITKTGTPDDGFDENRENYDPTGRTITWYIPVDNQGLTLYDLTITDVLPNGLTFESAVWQRWDADTLSWVPVIPAISWDAQPTGGVYVIGEVGYLGRLVIVSNVPDEVDGSVNYREYKNHANAAWESAGGSPGEDGAESDGVGIGYDAITKGGTQSDDDKANHQITWTINVDLMGQSATDFVYYDLFVHDAATTNGALTTATGWPMGLAIGNPGVSRNNGQKFVEVVSKDTDLIVDIIPLGTLGTLVKVSNLQATGSNQVVLKSQVLDPKILAGNKSNQTVPNVASLYKGAEYRGRDNASVSFNNMVLAKEMLNRVEVANDHDSSLSINPNNSTTTAANGFHYDYREVIFRLVVNAAGLDFTDVETNLTGGFGTVTVTDKLPDGWVFSPFSGGAMFLIYDADGNGVATTPALNPANISGFTPEVGTSTTATFTFTDLDQPYVILVKAKPTNETFDGYLVGADTRDETNTLKLQTVNWPTGVTVTQDVRINTKLIDKSIDITKQSNDYLTWSLDYTPFNRPIADGFQDVIPEGIDLRLDSSGGIIWETGGERNITVIELVPNENGNGGYTEATIELDLSVIQSNLTYKNETRTLTFNFPDKSKGYRLKYVTDITGEPGEIVNTAKLLGTEGGGTGTSKSFLITDQHGSAIMGRSGFVSIKKTDVAGEFLADAEFTLYNTDSDGNKSSPRAVRLSGSNDGTIRIYGLQPGTYILVETDPPSGYYGPPLEFIIVVAEDFASKINSTDMSIRNPFEIVNYQIPQASGGLTISKTVAGNGGDLTKLFEFQITFVGAPDVYPYTGNGVPNGYIASGNTFYLAHNQSITITGLPVDAKYTIVEKVYEPDGYITTYTGENGFIEEDETKTAAFTNTREIGSLTISKTVVGNGGDYSKLFSFTVTFTGAPYDYPFVGSGGAADGSITSGQTIQLKHGQSITINDLPKGATYTVVEADYSAEGYTTTYSGDTGTIVVAESQVASFTNTREVGSLTIKKTVAGDLADRNRYFTFIVEFGSNEVYYYHGSKAGAIQSGQSVQLKHDEYIIIEDILIGTTYKVIEVEANQGGYSTSYTGTVGLMETTGKTAAFVNWRSSVPNTGDDDSAAIVRVGLIISVSLLLVSTGVFGYIQSKKRKQTLS